MIFNEIVETAKIQAGGASIAIVLLIFLVVFVISILFLIFWIFMLVDAAKRKFKGDNEKVLWILLIVLTSWIGAIIYYFVIYRKK